MSLTGIERPAGACFLIPWLLVTMPAHAQPLQGVAQPLHSGAQPLQSAAQAGAGLPADAVLDDATLRREYDDYRASVEGLRLYHVRYIRVATEGEARELLGRLGGGEDFGELARRHSIHPDSAAEGGDLGTHAGCRWGKSTLAMLDSLQPGQTWPEPVKGTHGWGIYRLEAAEPVQPRPFAAYSRELLSGSFKPECPWVPPVTIRPAPAAPVPLPSTPK
jgi:hypothetical protein